MCYLRELRRNPVRWEKYCQRQIVIMRRWRRKKASKKKNRMIIEYQNQPNGNQEAKGFSPIPLSAKNSLLELKPLQIKEPVAQLGKAMKPGKPVVVCYKSSLELTWNPPVENANSIIGYLIQRLTTWETGNQKTWRNLKHVGSNVCRYHDATVIKNCQYRYRVKPLTLGNNNFKPSQPTKIVTAGYPTNPEVIHCPGTFGSVTVTSFNLQPAPNMANQVKITLLPDDQNLQLITPLLLDTRKSSSRCINQATKESLPKATIETQKQTSFQKSINKMNKVCLITEDPKQTLSFESQNSITCTQDVHKKRSFPVTKDGEEDTVKTSTMHFSKTEKQLESLFQSQKTPNTITDYNEDDYDTCDKYDNNQHTTNTNHSHTCKTIKSLAASTELSLQNPQITQELSKTLRELLKKEKAKKGLVLFVCNCDKAFFSKYYLDQHKLLHCREGKFDISVTNLTDKNSEKGLVVKKPDSFPSLFSCEICKETNPKENINTYVSAEFLLLHQQTKHKKQREKIIQKPKPEPYTCGLCGQSFKLKAYCLKHANKCQPNLENLPTSVAKTEMSVGNESLVIPLKAGNQASVPSCFSSNVNLQTSESCGNSYTTKESLKTHQMNHGQMTKTNNIIFPSRLTCKVNPQVCDTCGNSFTTKGSLKAHQMNRCEGSKLYKRVYNNNVNNKTVFPKRLISESKSLTCDHCNRSFTNKGHFSMHIYMCKQKAEMKPIMCELCGQLSRFNRHAHCPKAEKEKFRDYGPNPIYDSSTKRYKCDQCDSTFSMVDKVIHHKRAKHAGVLLQCPVCPKKCLWISTLNHHMESHATVKPHVCDVCSAAYALKSLLTYHKKIKHSSWFRNKGHKCRFCPVAFHCQSALKYHLRIHTGERPFVCQICNKSYTVKKSLNSHMKNVHMPQLVKPKRIICQTCNQSFANRCSYNNHVRIHTGERPFKCSVCGEAFRMKRQMKKHMDKHSRPI